jgi:hypothetical protein
LKIAKKTEKKTLEARNEPKELMDNDLRTWKIRVDVRCAVDLPMNNVSEFNTLPSTFVGKEPLYFNNSPFRGWLNDL